MAFLVLYSETITEENYSNQAIYLNQKFYKIIFKKCYKKDGYPLLHSIANLGYKDNPIVIENKDLPSLVTEIQDLSNKVIFKHKQLSEFIEVANTAFSTKRHLRISGDMYPELK